MKNIICFFTLILCVMVSTVNAQKATTSRSTSIVLNHTAPVVIEDVDTKDAAVRNMAMLLEEVSPEAAPVITVALTKGFPKVATMTEDTNTEDAAMRNIAMMQEEVSPEAVETNIAGNYNGNEKVNAKY